MFLFYIFVSIISFIRGELDWFVLLPVFIFFSLIYSPNGIAITDETGIEIKQRSKQVWANWSDLKEYTYDGMEFTLIPRNLNSKPIHFSLDNIQNIDELLALLDEKLGYLDFDCLECGARIPAASEECPNCHWTWQGKDGLENQ